jgi:hypothetical protein
MLNTDLTINAAIDYVNNHPLHHLDIGIRRSIWLLLGDSFPEKGLKNAPRKKRFLLSKMCAKYVQNIHVKYFYNNLDILNLYSSAINISSLYWNEETTLEKIDIFARKFYIILEELGNIEELRFESLEYNLSHERAIFAMTSAWECMRVSLYDEPFNEKIDNDLKDTDIDIVDIYAADSAYWAAAAYAGSIWDLENSDRGKRLKFWKWWLEEAIPQVLKM